MISTTYTQGAELPDLTVEWKDATGAIINFSSGYTFELRLGIPGSAASLTKTTGITGAATAPNVWVAWASSGELNTLAPGFYHAHLRATRTSDGKLRVLKFGINIDAAVA